MFKAEYENNLFILFFFGVVFDCCCGVDNLFNKFKNVFIPDSKLFESIENFASNSIFSIDSFDKVIFEDNEFLSSFLLLSCFWFNTVELLLIIESDSEEDVDKFDEDDDVDEFY